MTPEVISVSQFLDILNETLSFAYPEVTILGEVSGFKINQNKWVFFDIKDEDSTLGCFMSKFQLKVPLEDGMQVRVVGTPKITKWGKFSFTVKRVELAGEGELKRAFELLKAKLGAEGLFSPDRKRALPRYPQTIGLVTSAQSAAYADFMKILASRWGGLTVQLIDVQVQGAPAPEQVAAAVRQLSELATPPDVVVVIRGGGSLEDLQAFNSEQVARAIAASRVPTIVGVGHEVDVSLADMVADVRAATPTDAARLVVPDRVAVGNELTATAQRWEAVVARRLLSYHHHIRVSLGRLETVLRRPLDQVARHQASLQRDFARVERLAQLQAADLEQRRHQLILGMQRQSARRREQLVQLVRNLRAVDPTAVLARGYSIVRQGGKSVTAAASLQPGAELMIQFSQGSAQARVERTEEEA